MKKLILIGAIPWLIQSATAATIPNAPPFVTSSAYANVLVDMSVETPMGGAAYADQNGNPAGCTGRSTHGGGEVGACYFSDTTYLGIFDPEKCYTYSSTSNRFNPASAATNHSCSSQWSGNFLNWATMTAADMFIWTMTGGDREDDSTTQTVLQRARVVNNISWFPIKYIADASGVTPYTGAIYITNHSEGGYQFKAGTTRGGNEKGSKNVKVKVCDPTKGLEANCKGYTSGATTVYKPEGVVQRYADKMRFGVFAYTTDNSQSRDGGVLRAPMRYVGEKEMDGTGNLIANTAREINPDTGQIYQNPLGASGGLSGVINYINRFHRDNYKSYDPVSELFYEAVRYYKNVGPTPEYASGAPSDSFPIYTTWSDPIQFACQKNFMVAINDANPWLDKKLPGTFFTCGRAGTAGMPASFTASDCGEPSNPDTSINVTDLTNTVGSLEGITPATWTQNNTTGSDTVGYVNGVSSNVGNCNDGKSVAVTNLAELMGTCPYAPKQNAYYIAGLAYYANTTDLRSDFAGTQNVNTFMIDTQEYNPNPLNGNKNMLYLTGKYGGFIDLNGNNQPDLTAEWDANADGQPDNYVLASVPDKLVQGLQRAFNNILAKSGSASNVTANSTQFSTDSLVFQAKFNSGVWSGDLLSYPVSSSGVGTTPIWQASNVVPLPANRHIYTISGGVPKEFLWGQLTATDQTALGSQDVLDYIRGVRTKEAQNGGSLRNRSSVLGDIVDSSPYYEKDINAVYAGANDGMLHAFDGNTGAELFAYIPSAAIPGLNNLTQLSYTHQYFVDGDVVISSTAQTPSHNYLVAALGRGGKGLFGLDVTNSASFGTSGVKWECFYTGGTVADCNGDADLGYMLGRPVIANMNDGSTAVIIGNGYNSTSGKAVLYVVNLETGAVIKKIDTGVASDNGLAGPGVYDSDGNGTIDFVYAGDMKGNVWKFDLSGGSSAGWGVALSALPLFVAKDASNVVQPITAPLAVAVDKVASDDNYNKLFVFFGTGSYFRSGDPGDSQVQSWYGLIDENSQISGRSALEQRTVLDEGTASGFSVRTFTAAADHDMVGKKGWYIDFTTHPGERIVTASQLYKLAEPTLVASSIIPLVDPCIPGGNGYVNAVNPFTGARLTQGLFDVNNNADFTDDKLNGNYVGGIDLGVAMPTEPVLVGNRLVVGGSSGGIKDIAVNLGGGVNKGRISWREIRSE